MKSMNIKLMLGAALLSVGLATPALAEGLSGTAAVTTNYIFRGITQTMDKPTVQASIGYDFGDGFSLGAWGSGIDFSGAGDSESSLETDYYGAYATSFGDLGVTLGATYYAYPTSTSHLKYNYYELSGAVSYPLGPVTANASAYWSPEFFGGADAAWYFGAGLSAPITDYLSVAGNYGYQTVDTAGYFIGTSESTDAYNTWNLGATATYEKFSLNLMYSQTDLPAPMDDAKFVATLSVAFP